MKIMYFRSFISTKEFSIIVKDLTNLPDPSSWEARTHIIRFFHFQFDKLLNNANTKIQGVWKYGGERHVTTFNCLTNSVNT